MEFNGVEDKCGVELNANGVEVFSSCCGCGDVLSEEKARELTRALMARFGITESRSNA